MTEQKHTPTPWEHNGIEYREGGATYVEVTSKDSAMWVAKFQKAEDANLAIAAVNSHNALVEAARISLIALYHEAPGGCWATGPLTGNPVTDLAMCPGCNAIQHLKDALRAAGVEI